MIHSHSLGMLVTTYEGSAISAEGKNSSWTFCICGFARVEDGFAHDFSLGEKLRS